MRNIFKEALYPDDQLETEVALLARLLWIINPEIDEFESFDILCEFLESNQLDFKNIEMVGKLIRTTIFDPKRHTMN